ncbi:MAG TPA: hypothetical protein VKE22_07970 [Haliangiales bacterium]|nr:hypothetical protein [Haliangiales bacterium]
MTDIRKTESAEPPLSAVFGWGDLPTSLFAIFPLYLVYAVGIAFLPAMNGVDFVSRNLFILLGRSQQNYLIAHAVLAAVFLAAAIVSRRTHTGLRRRFLPMVLESAIYALTLGSLIWFVMYRILGMAPLAVGGLSESAQSVVLSFGAGVHEELVFRLGAFAGGAALLRLLGIRHTAAILITFLASSALFSAAHHLGPAGDPWDVSVFVYRTLAGCAFAAIFYFRSLAHAAYTHALYDVYVMILKQA